jgi:hypothetical protein
LDPTLEKRYRELDKAQKHIDQKRAAKQMFGPERPPKQFVFINVCRKVVVALLKTGVLEE